MTTRPRHNWRLYGEAAGWQVWECRTCGRTAIPTIFGFIWPWPRCVTCHHERVRCVHGDEIVRRGYARSACLDCGRSLKPLPDMCWYAGEMHAGVNA